MGLEGQAQCSRSGRESSNAGSRSSTSKTTESMASGRQVREPRVWVTEELWESCPEGQQALARVGAGLASKKLIYMGCVLVGAGFWKAHSGGGKESSGIQLP